MKSFIAGLIAVLSLTFAFPAEAGRGEWKKNHEKMMSELNLTAEQQTKMKALKESSKAGLKDKKKAMRAAREDLGNALKGTASDADVRKKFEALSKLQDEFAKARFEHVLAVRAILTPEQRAKFHEMKGKIEGRRGMHHDDDDEGEE